VSTAGFVLVGLGFLLASIWSAWKGEFSVNDGFMRVRRVRRDSDPLEFWVWSALGIAIGVGSILFGLFGRPDG